MIYPAIPLAQTILLHCKANNIKHIVLSPGSRNAPLTIGFTNDDFFTCHSIIDERAAAFFAMGIAQQQQYPVALVCTSGSALLNYYPAIAEAFYSDIPLLIISADRPANKIDIGDGQTIRQENVFSNHIVYAANLKDESDYLYSKSDADKQQPNTFFNVPAELREFNNKEVSKAIGLSIADKGPVHINVPFEEPLYPTVTEPWPELVALATPAVNPESNKFELPKEFMAQWNKASKKMILVGVLQPGTISHEVITTLANDPSVVVFTETTSNLHHPDFFPSIDKILAPIEKNEALLEQFHPEMLVTIGGMIVSKKIKAFLRKYTPKQHYHIDPKKAYDTFFCLTEHLKTDVNTVFSSLKNALNVKESDYKSFWLQTQEKRRELHKQYVNKISYSDFVVYRELFQALPNDHHLQLSNSSVIRYTQLFDLKYGWDVFCNRGTSGIDGSTSTAVGASVINTKPTTLVTGDLSFLYDSNGLWNTNGFRNDFTIIVINNSGGGIFRILPGYKAMDVFDKYFETIHNYTMEPLATMYGFGYEKITDETSLKKVLPKVYNNLKERKQPLIVEVVTPRLENDTYLINYFKYLAGN